MCTKEDYERVNLGDSFEDAASTEKYNELCVDTWENITLSENKKVTTYSDLRIYVKKCDPKNN